MSLKIKAMSFLDENIVRRGTNNFLSQFDKSGQNGNEAKPTKIHTDTKTEY